VPTPDRATRSDVRRLARPAVVVAGVAAIGTAWLLSDGGDVRIADVPSYWDDVIMTCRTTRVEQGAHTFETFACHSDGATDPPPGRYDEDNTVWYSDIDRRRAKAHRIVITRSGSVTGWAAY
jgi:hypothetical protein